MSNGQNMKHHHQVHTVSPVVGMGDFVASFEKTTELRLERGSLEPSSPFDRSKSFHPQLRMTGADSA